MLNVRMYTWMQGGLSWAYVMSRLAQAFDELGNNVYVTSTNGLQDNEDFINKDRMISSIIELQRFGPGRKAIDIDLTYTVPQNFPQRFLSNSKHKCAIYNYETTYWVPQWKKYYGLADYYFPSSNFSAEVFCLNGIPPEKIWVIPHGIDTNMFNPNVPAIKLKTKKQFKFVSVVAPHYRKNIDVMLEAYCRAFKKNDDVCLVLKTKVYRHSDGAYDIQKNPKGRKPFEIVLGDIFKTLTKKYGKNMPEIEILNGHVENVSSIYNACDCHVSATGAEGFGMIFPEAAACGLLNIAPRYSGHLDFLNDENALLIDTKLRKAKNTEQYWSYHPRSKIGSPDINHMAELMQKAVQEKDSLMDKFAPETAKMISRLSWNHAAQKIIDATEGKLPHYVPGTYDLFNQHNKKNVTLKIYEE